MPDIPVDENALINFYHGEKDKIEKKVQDGTVNGSDFFVSADTDEFIFVDKELNLHPLRFRTQVPHQVQLGEGSILGGFTEGDILDPGTDMDEFVEKLFRRVVPPEYVKPTLKLSIKDGQKPGKYEIGTQIKTTVHAEYKQNDGGELSEGKIYSSGNSQEFDKLPGDFDFSFTLGSETVNIYAEAQYEDGPIKKDNYENDFPSGRILSGLVKSNTLAYKGVNFMFFGTSNEVLPEQITSAFVRSLECGKSIEDEEQAFEFEIASGTRSIIIAVPASEKDRAIRVEYVDLGDSHMLDAFAKDEIEVENLDGSGLTSYYLYTYEMAVPAMASMTFKIII